MVAYKADVTVNICHRTLCLGIGLQVRVCAGASDLSIKVSDQGGGIPSHSWDSVWKYGYTSIPPEGLGQGRLMAAAGGGGADSRFRMAGKFVAEYASE